MSFDNKDYYGVLGVLPNVEDFLIKAAYKVLAQKYHPDKFNDSKQQAAAEVKMKAINEAYCVLSDVKNRRLYDDYLKKNNKQNEYHEEESVETDSSEMVNEVDWQMAVEYVPELKTLYDNLKIISPNLAFNFKLYVLGDKAFNKAKDVADELETTFLTTFFGDNKDIIIFAKFLLKNKHRDAAKELNKAVKLFEGKIEAKEIVKNIRSKYKIDYSDNFTKKDSVSVDYSDPYSGYVFKGIGYVFWGIAFVLVLLWIMTLVHK